MNRKQSLFVILGVILIGIAILTEYASSKIPSSWTMAKNDVPGTVRQPVVFNNNINFAGISGRENSFPLSLQNSIRAINR